MFEKALLDGDIIAYRCAAATAKESEDIACWQAGEMITRIMHETNAISHRVFLTGSNNFRYSIYPDYKANRKDVPKPEHLPIIREYLCSVWDATVTDGYEADDAMGMEQDETSVICSIDKDMLMIPGWHYNFVKQEQRYVTPLDGLRHFYKQAILGDKTDNIPGWDGKFRDKVPKFMQWMFDEIDAMDNEVDMYNFIQEHHEYDPIPYLKCLWIWRKEGDIWTHERMDRGTEESFRDFRFTSGLQTVAAEVRDIEGSLPREEDK